MVTLKDNHVEIQPKNNIKQKPRKKKVKAIKNPPLIKKGKSSAAVGGSVEMKDISFPNDTEYYADTGYTNYEVRTHVPLFQNTIMEDQNKIVKTLKAKEEDVDFSSSYFYNNMQSIDYLVCESVLSNTIAGAFVSYLRQFVIGEGFKPKLELIESTGSEEGDIKKLEEGEPILKELMAIDQNIDDNCSISFTNAVSQCVENMFGFNRSAIAFGYDQSYTGTDGVLYKNIPGFIFPLHPRDLGMLEQNKNWQIESVQHASTSIRIKGKDMIYFFDPTLSGTAYRANFYGKSRILPCLDSCREIKNITGITLPAVNHSAWAGMAVINVIAKGQDKSEKQTLYNEISKNFRLGSTNLLATDDPITVHNITLNGETDKLIVAANFHLKIILSSLGLPLSLVADEGESNRATAIEKIRLTRTVTIDPIRKMLGELLEREWYRRNFKIIYGDKPESKIYKVCVEFEDYKLETWIDKISAFKELSSMFAIKNKEAGEMLGIDNFESKIDPDAEPLPDTNRPTTVTDPNGDKYDVQNG